MTGPADDLRPLYRTIVALGGVAVLILAAGLVDFFYFEPPGQATGLRVPIRGVYAYDPDRHTLKGPPANHFDRDQPFAAAVDWAALPPGVVVAAHWYNTLDEEVGGIGPNQAGQLAQEEAPVPVKTPPDLRHNLPGRYTLAVLRYRSGQPVEQLARRTVSVDRGG